jgi:transketolase
MATATRDAWGEAIARIGADERVVVLSGDLRDSTKVEGFIERYPERYVECGIAEMNMLGIASGLALSGKIPWACSFSAFVTGRMEIIRVAVSYQEANVRIVGTHCGIGVGEDGYSQMSLQDIASIRALQNVAIVQPADAVETERAVEYLVEHEGPAFLRLTRQKVEDVHDKSYTFAFGKMDRLRDGGDVALVATGATVGESLKAAEILKGRGIEAGVVNVHTIKPIDEEGLLQAAAGVPLLVTVEDHGIWGGLGGAVAEVLAQAPANGSGPHARLHVIGVRGFGESGTSEELYELHGLSGARIADTVEAELKGI